MRFFLLLLLTSCFSREPAHFKGIAMEMPYHIQIAKRLNGKEQCKIEGIIDEIFNLVNQTFNHWNHDSELSKLNRLAAGEPMPISDELFQLLSITDQIVQLSEGKFDPTLGKVIQLWKERKSPAIEDLKGKLSWEYVHFDNQIFSKDYEEIELDLDGIAKGHAIDLLVERLNQEGFANVYVEWAGDIRTSGKHIDGRKWSILIVKDEQIIDHIYIANGSVATSGDYLQNWQIADKTYCHIIDKKSLMAMEVKKDSIASATVLSPTCAFADGLATTTLLQGSAQQAKLFAKSLPENSFWIVPN